MSSFNKRVYAAGWKALIARGLKHKDLALEAHEEQRLLYLHATDDEIDEMVASFIEQMPRFKEKKLIISACFLEMRELARDKQAWHSQHQDSEP